MSTWRIFPDARNGLRWEVSGRIIRSKPQDDPNISLNEPLPSMADLLLRGCAKLMEDEESGDSKPIFRNGLGKSVVIKESSIAKALSVLGNVEETDSDVVLPTNNVDGYSGSLFQTGSGKKVNVSSAGMSRARALLGLEKDNAPCDQHGFKNPRKLQVPNNKSRWQDSSCFDKSCLQNLEKSDTVSTPRQPSNFESVSGGSKAMDRKSLISMHSKMFESGQKPPQLKFQTAGGRLLSVSAEALKRARSLLGDPEIGSFLYEASTRNTSSKFSKEIRIEDTSSNMESGYFASVSHEQIINKKDKDFTPPLKSHSKKMKYCAPEKNTSGTNLIEKFDEVGNARSTALMSNIPTAQKLSSNKMLESTPVNTNSLKTGTGSGMVSVRRSSDRVLTDVSNIIPSTYTNSEQSMNGKQRIGRISSASPFKRPRSSKFSTPFKKNAPHVHRGTSTLSSEHSCDTRKISTKYPFPVPRVPLKEYFGVLPSACNEYLSDKVKQIRPDNADKYLFSDESGHNCIGIETFHDMLAKSGASMQYISKEWITNHYKWIVWKLASYERHYTASFWGKFFTVSSVLEELKYRYEREVNYGHRSAIRQILEGDALPSMMMVLCISSIYLKCGSKIQINNATESGAESRTNFKVEVTDGWYSMEATLDVLLSKQLAAGKLFVGQKLRIWGAGLCGWVGPISPLQAGTVSLVLNINGTYRAHWADRLGFCKGAGAPLAFRCIKSDGGRIPRTLAGVTRIYPVLYKERLSNGGSVVRSEKMENKIAQLHSQRRLAVTEGVLAEYQKGINSPHITDFNESEGAKIFNILETAAEPEIIMAEMSSEQLASFSSFKAKLEATRQSEMEKSIEMALAKAGLNEREVAPFMRVRVVGLSCRNYNGKGRTKEGIITLWNPTEQQRHELVEGHAYSITGLMPLPSKVETLYLQARGSATKWHSLSPSAAERFQPFFTPRKSITLSNLGDIPTSSEFDVVGFIVHVGEAYSDDHISHRKKQWVFVTDGSASDLQPESSSKSLLAICFCSYIQDDSFEPINSNLEGSTVGFCNLVKRAQDWVNHVWVAEATENSTYSLKFDSGNSHLKNAAASVQMWAKVSTLVRIVKLGRDLTIIEKLREKVLFIISESKR